MENAYETRTVDQNTVLFQEGRKLKKKYRAEHFLDRAEQL